MYSLIPTFYCYAASGGDSDPKRLINNIGPFITIALGYIVLRENINIYDVAGMVLVIFGIFLIKYAKV